MAVNCWTLWQRMPPRFQLTLKDVKQEDQEESQTYPATPSTPRIDSALSSRLRTPRGSQTIPSRQASLSHGVTTMISMTELEEDSRLPESDSVPLSPFLPLRRSPYIKNMKSQIMLNSTRRKMDEALLTSRTPSSYTPKSKAYVPPFPITKLSNHDCPATPALSQTSTQEHYKQFQHRMFHERRPAKRSSSPAQNLKHVPVRTITPFAEFSPESTLLHRASPRQHDCVIGDYQMAALYVDRGKVTFFRKTKPDMAQSVYSAMNPFATSKDDGSYLSHLRKVYLKGVRDLAKTSVKQTESEKQATIKARMDYDRKVGRILDYYTSVDISKDEDTHGPPLSCTVPMQHRGFRPQIVRRKGFLPTAASDGNFTTNDDTQRSQDAKDIHHTCQRHQDANGFLRINAQARLHRRQFYLSTPVAIGAKPEGRSDMANCVCGMCRLEMEVSLLAKLQRDMGFPINTIAATRGITLQRSDGTGALGAASVLKQSRVRDGRTFKEDDDCPARPNSVSDSHRKMNSGLNTHLPTPQVGNSQDSDQGYKKKSQGDAFVSAYNEPTCLTVKLPGIEEMNERVASSTSVREMGEETVNDRDEDDKLVDHTLIDDTMQRDKDTLEIVRNDTTYDGLTHERETEDKDMRDKEVQGEEIPEGRENVKDQVGTKIYENGVEGPLDREQVDGSVVSSTHTDGDSNTTAITSGIVDTEAVNVAIGGEQRRMNSLDTESRDTEIMHKDLKEDDNGLKSSESEVGQT